jgi:hypothetical protein
LAVRYADDFIIGFTVLCGGRAMKRTSLPLQRRYFIALLGGAAAACGFARDAID